MIKLVVYSLVAGATCSAVLSVTPGVAGRIVLAFFLVKVLIAAARDRIARRSCR